jgi:hypothetical protein
MRISTSNSVILAFLSLGVLHAEEVPAADSSPAADTLIPNAFPSQILPVPNVRKHGAPSYHPSPMKTKTIPLVILTAAAFGAALHAQETKTADAQPATARILGDFPDGTPPAPEAAKPAFIVRSRDILKTETHQQGGRTITVQQIKPIALPEPAKPVSLPDPATPAVEERIAEVQSAYPEQEMLLIGATVFHTKDATARSLVTLSPLGGGEPVTFFSSADFALLSGFASFVGSDGETHALLMSWGNEEIGTLADLATKRGLDYGLTKIPELPTGKATFAVLSEKPDAATLASIQSLHDLYNNEHDKLLAAYQGREKARVRQETELKAHPPKPKDITLNYWRTETPTAQQKKETTR